MTALTRWLGIGLSLASTPVVLSTGYLAMLALAARHLPQSQSQPRTIRFQIIVPAHNEELGIERTIQSLSTLDYPASLRRVLVVADNCTDATAQRAQTAGADVLERNDPARRGKGYALHCGFQYAEAQRWADAVVVVDADTSVSPNLLLEFARAIERGADAMQADYGVRNADESWRTRLMSVALGLFHGVRSLARERLAVSTGLRGNGMAFTREVLARVPHDAYSVVEDIEYGLKLGMAGIRVHYLPYAHVSGDMAVDERSSSTQRQRWESGRRTVTHAYGLKLLTQGLRRRDPVLLDLWLDLVVPPLTTLVLLCGAGAITTAAVVIRGSQPVRLLVPWLLSCGFIGAYVLRGAMLSGTGAQSAMSLLRAPAFVVWKMVLAARRRGPLGEWVRTARSGESMATAPSPPA